LDWLAGGLASWPAGGLAGQLAGWLASWWTGWLMVMMMTTHTRVVVKTE